MGKNPVTGKPSLKGLHKLTFHKNADGQSHSGHAMCFCCNSSVNSCLALHKDADGQSHLGHAMCLCCNSTMEHTSVDVQGGAMPLSGGIMQYKVTFHKNASAGLPCHVLLL